VTGPYVLAIDQGTGSTKALLVDRSGAVVARGQAPLKTSTPKPGWVEQDGDAIWNSVLAAIREAVTPERAREIAAIGLSTQRESCLVFERNGGKALTPLLSWQDQRTIALCGTIGAADRGYIRERTGLPLDPMFSAVKASWLLDQIDLGRRRAGAGEIVVGTIDAFLLARFGADPLVEIGNASRTQLLAIDDGAWDERLLALFNIPAAALPRVVPSTGPFTTVKGIAPLLDGTPITAVLADSHAALFAHGAFEPGKIKATQGTGSSVMGLYDPAVGAETIDAGVCRTIAWQIDRPAMAFEGNIRSVGSTLTWLAGILGTDTAALAVLAASVEDTGGVAIVPAFGGLGAPYWDADAVGIVGGVTLGTSQGHMARAAIESIAHQIADVLDRVRASGLPVDALYVDGGPTRNDMLMQLEADLFGTSVHRSDTAELSALGAAHFAGLAGGIWDRPALAALARNTGVFTPTMPAAERMAARRHWRTMVRRARGLFADNEPGDNAGGQGGHAP
jgi:glycerol kinase